MRLPPVLSRLAAFADLTPADLAALLPIAGQKRKIKRGEHLIREGDATKSIFLLLEGWTASSITVADGSRQMLRLQLPGDVIGLPSLSVTHAPETVTSLTPVTFATISLPAIGKLFTDYPRMAALLFLVSQHERVLLMDRLTAIGRISAPGRLAGLLLQIHDRLLRQDPEIGDTIVLPLIQEDLADLIGTSHVHLSRIMAELRRTGVISYDRRSVTLRSKEELRALSGLPKRVVNMTHDWLPPGNS